MLSRPRLYSREGCLRCRLRRKKCDEQHPICVNCQRLGLTCMWKSADNPSVHVFYVNKSLAALEITLRFKDENCRYTSQYIPQEHTPLGKTLSDFTKMRNDVEYGLLSKLSGFLTSLSPSKKDEVTESHNHVFALGLQNIWVRDALVAFAAFAFSTRDQSLRALAYNTYQLSIKEVQRRIAMPNYTKYSEELLVATIFLGLVEVNNPENLVFPLLHFEAVGHLLNQVATRNVSGTVSASIFHRIASESYLYHVSILSLYYPQTNRFTTLSTAVDRQLGLFDSTIDNAMIIGMDANIYRVLFMATLLGRADRSSPHYLSRVETADSILRDVSLRTDIAMSAQHLTAKEKEFWTLTRFAYQALQIYLTKVRDPSALAKDEIVRVKVTAAIETLESLSISRAWTGNLVWTLAIMLCAAYTVSDVAAIDKKVQEVKEGLWGADLLRLTQTVYRVRKQREQSSHSNRTSGGRYAPGSPDTLALLLNHNGILAY